MRSLLITGEHYRASERLAFNEDNDPWGEHDFGAFEVAGVGKVNWRIDDYEDETDGAENKLKGYPVLTIMLAEDY